MVKNFDSEKNARLDILETSFQLLTSHIVLTVKMTTPFVNFDPSSATTCLLSTWIGSRCAWLNNVGQVYNNTL